MKRCIYFILVGMAVSFSAWSQTNPKLAVKVYKRDTLFNCIAADSLGNVYAASSQKGIFKFDGSQWKDWTGGNGSVGLRKCFMKHMAGAKEGVWLTHSGFTLSVTGAGPATFYANATGGVEYIPATHPAQRVKYQGRAILTRRLTQGPSTKSGLAIAIDKNGTVWSAANYADSQRYYYYDGITVTPDRYYYSPGGLTFKTASGAGFDTVVNGMPWPGGINISIGTDGKTDTWSIGKRRVARAVGVINSLNEVWVSMDSMQATTEVFSNCILRYDLSGNYLGKIDNTGTGLPMGPGTGYTGATSIYEDAKGRIWLGFGNKGIGVKDNTGNWTYIPSPPLLPVGTQIRPNAISGNKNGEVYFGTLNGLYVYRCVNGSYTNDTSYRLFTTADSLPSNNILGVTVDKKGNIWLATGTAIARIEKGALRVYNQKTTNGVLIVSDADNNKRLIRSCGTCTENVDVMVAADSSEVTQFEFEYAGNPDEISFVIKEANGATDNAAKARYGYFDPTPAANKKAYDNGKIKWLYHHPTYIKADSDADLDTDKKGYTVTFDILKNGVPLDYLGDGTKQKIKIVFPPLILVHGLWDHGNDKIEAKGSKKAPQVPAVTEKGCFTDMETRLRTNGNYFAWQYNKVDYEATHNASFNTNRPVVPNAINKILDDCFYNGVSVGKVDIVCHSMGGDLSRRYLQSTAYKNDINRLITLNTPHGGSQVANWYVLNRIMRQARSLGGLNCGLALRDLRVNFMDRPYNGAIAELNSPAQLARSKNVALHAIATTADRLSQYDENGAAGTFENSTYNVANEDYDAAPWYRKPVIAAARRARNEFFDRTECTYADRAVECFKKLYRSNNPAGLNDNAVGYTSQQGGLPTNAITPLTNIPHSESPSNAAVINKVVQLLKANPDGTSFSKDGYGAVNLTHYQRLPITPETDGMTCDLFGGTLVSYPNGRGLNELKRLKFLSPPSGSTFKPLDTVHFEIKTDTVYGVELFSDFVSSNDYQIKFDTGATFKMDYIIPLNAANKITFVAAGYDTIGYVNDDTTFINIGTPTGVTLNSISIFNKELLKVFKGDSIVVNLKGIYSDTTRNITYLSGISYALEEGNAAPARNGIKGVTVGLDRLFVTYQGKRDTAYVEVVERIADPFVVIPVTFSDIYAQFRNNRVEVNWSTETEINNKEFEVQRSLDGIQFETFTRVPGKMFSTGTNWYAAFDPQYSIGRNFYRIKQVDLDGNFKYSKVVMVLIKDKVSVLLYPNPARTEVYVAIGSQVNAKTLRVVNTMGQPVMTRTVTGNGQTVNIGISQLSAGVYFTELFNSNNESVWRGTFVKE